MTRKIGFLDEWAKAVVEAHEPKPEPKLTALVRELEKKIRLVRELEKKIRLARRK